MSEKTEKPTEKKLKDLKKKGEMIKSDELSSSVQFISVFLILIMFGGAVIKSIIELIHLTTTRLDTELHIKLKPVIGFVTDNILFFCILLVSLVTISFLFTWAQTGIFIAWDKLKPSLKKINPATNLKSIFSFKNVLEQIKSLIKFFVFSLFVFFLVNVFIIDIILSFNVSAHSGMSILLHCIQFLWLGSSLVFILFAFFDIWFQKKMGKKNIMMSKDEVKREYKDAEGNPELKSERKRLHQEIQSGSLSQTVKKSTLILKNPTHIAVCLYFEVGITPLPKVLKYGIDNSAEQILELASQYGIPVIENIPLARALKKNIKPGEYITEDFFEPIAEILRLVMNLDY